jgi:hypothetical protein
MKYLTIEEIDSIISFLQEHYSYNLIKRLEEIKYYTIEFEENERMRKLLNLKCFIERDLTKT